MKRHWATKTGKVYFTPEEELKADEDQAKMEAEKANSINAEQVENDKKAKKLNALKELKKPRGPLNTIALLKERQFLLEDYLGIGEKE